MVASTNGRPRNLRATRGSSNGRKEAPDCPVCTGQCPVRQWAWSCNGRLCLFWKEIVHQTVYRTCPVAHLWGTDIPRVHWKDKRPHERPKSPINRKVTPSWAWGGTISKADRRKARSVQARMAPRRRASDHNRRSDFPALEPRTTEPGEDKSAKS
jgi:hypothetical protein